MPYLHPYRLEQLSKWLSTGGHVAAIAGPRRSGLTSYVSRLLPSWTGQSFASSSLISLDMREHPLPSDVLTIVADKLRLDAPPTNVDELTQAFLDASVHHARYWYFKNFHKATPETQQLLTSACLHRRLPHGTNALSDFIFEGAVDFESLIATRAENIQPLIAHVEPSTPWRTIVEVEQMISELSSSHYPRSLIVWLADITNGDTGFCNEFLLRLNNPTPTLDVLSSTYQAIIRKGATARELREIAIELNPRLIETLLAGNVIPGLAPPDGDASIQELFYAGIVQYDPLVRGYSLKSSMVRDALQHEKEWGVTLTVPEQCTARCSDVLWQVASVEILLRNLLNQLGDQEEELKEISVPPPWKGKGPQLRDKVVQSIRAAGLEHSVEKQMIASLSKVINDELPEKLPALDVAKTVLSATGKAEHGSLVDGLTFSGLSDLARRLNIVTIGEREELNYINARRNDAAHFRPIQYDEAYRLEETVESLLANINKRDKKAGED